MTVADAAQRSGMSESDLRAMNNVPPRMLIKAGSTLIVPRGARVKEDVAAVVADGGHLSFQPEIVNRRTTVKAGRNDSVTSIARRYNLKPTNVAEWNDVKPNHAFKRGYSVVVYLPVRAAPAARVGAGVAVARGHAAVASSKRGGAPAQANTARGKNVVKVPAGKQVVREKRGGTPSKKKR
jgi:membrane-bound lytic murein transglycosylase D